MMGDGWMTYAWPGMWLGHVLWIVFLIGFVWLLIDRIRPRETAPRSPLRLHEERFALGEIDAAEYEARRKVLSH